MYALVLNALWAITFADEMTPEPVNPVIVARNLGWAVVFSVVGGLVGMGLVLLASLILPKLIERITPQLDEEKEIARGNVAVAEYFGRVVGASILGTSLVVAAAILGGIIAALH